MKWIKLHVLVMAHNVKGSSAADTLQKTNTCVTWSVTITIKLILRSCTSLVVNTTLNCICTVRIILQLPGQGITSHFQMTGCDWCFFCRWNDKEKKELIIWNGLENRKWVEQAHCSHYTRAFGSEMKILIKSVKKNWAQYVFMLLNLFSLLCWKSLSFQVRDNMRKWQKAHISSLFKMHNWWWQRVILL